MTPIEIKALVETLRSCGVTHYKSGDVELDLGPAPALPEPKEESNTENIHKVQELTSLLKLDDKSLVDRLFPDYSQQNTGEAEEPADQS